MSYTGTEVKFSDAQDRERVGLVIGLPPVIRGPDVRSVAAPLAGMTCWRSARTPRPPFQRTISTGAGRLELGDALIDGLEGVPEHETVAADRIDLSEDHANVAGRASTITPVGERVVALRNGVPASHRFSPPERFSYPAKRVSVYALSKSRGRAKILWTRAESAARGRLASFGRFVAGSA